MTNMKQVFINTLLTLQAINEDKLTNISAADQNSKPMFPQIEKLSVRIPKYRLNINCTFVFNNICIQISGDKIKRDEPIQDFKSKYHSTAKPKNEEDSDSRPKEANSDVPFTFWNNNFVDLSHNNSYPYRARIV